jgi:hypothetical protein
MSIHNLDQYMHILSSLLVDDWLLFIIFRDKEACLLRKWGDLF